jgi:hypothetical protein
MGLYLATWETVKEISGLVLLVRLSNIPKMEA